MKMPKLADFVRKEEDKQTKKKDKKGEPSSQKDKNNTKDKLPFQKDPVRPWDMGDRMATILSKNTTHSSSSDLNPSEKSTNKVPTKYQQSDNKVPTKSNNNLNKVVTEISESDNKVPSQVVTQVATQVPTKYQQSDNESSNESDNKKSGKILKKYSQKPSSSVLELTGIQKHLLTFVFWNCKSKGSTISDPIAISHLSSHCDCSVNVAKESIRRLQKKGLLDKYKFHDGRGGYTEYELPKSVYTEFLNLESIGKVVTKVPTKVVTEISESDNKVPSQVVTQVVTNAPSSSSIKDLTTTTENTPLRQNQDPSILDAIRFDALVQIGFKRYHLEQIVEKSSLGLEDIQDSIDAFAFDLKENNKASEWKKTPLGVFMGILTKGRPYTPPENFESEHDKALRLHLERKKALKIKRQNLENEAIELAFEEWLESLKNEDVETLSLLDIHRNILLKDLQNTSVLNLPMASKAILRNYFIDNFWGKEKLKIQTDLLV